jgi:HAMP domain-containing protein
VYRGTGGWRRLDLRTPIFNESSCSQAECLAHPADVKTLGVLDLSLNLQNVDHEVSSMQYRVPLVTAVEVTLIGLFIIFSTRRFVGQPIEKLIAGRQAISHRELDKPLDIAGNSEELDELARSFDVMRDRVLRGRPFAFREGLAVWPSTFFLFILSAAAVGPSFLAEHLDGGENLTQAAGTAGSVTTPAADFRIAACGLTCWRRASTRLSGLIAHLPKRVTRDGNTTVGSRSVREFWWRKSAFSDCSRPCWLPSCGCGEDGW